MDKPLTKKRTNKSYKAVKFSAIAIGLGCAVFAYAKVNSSSGKTLNVTSQNLIINTVSQSAFNEYLPLRAVVEPQDTIFIDAIDGGRVEQVYVQEGELVEQGQPLLKLSNTNLQLNVLAREAEVSEQINNMRNTRLALEQNKLALKRDVIELDFEVLRLEKEFARSKALYAKKLISAQSFERIKDELEYQIKYRETVKESQEKEALLQNQQLQQLSKSIETLKANLAISHASLEKLIIRAPSAGQLTFLDAKVGESKSNGQRLGQVDLIQQYKVSAQVDEFYVGRVNKGQFADFSVNGQNYALSVSKVYPGINNGKFKVDFELDNQDLVSQLRLGQSVQIKFNLSASEQKLQIANGGFMQNTAGSWAFVLDTKTNTATKRAIHLGRKTPDSIEVLSGLQPGDQVITSSYATFADADQLNISN